MESGVQIPKSESKDTELEVQSQKDEERSSVLGLSLRDEPRRDEYSVTKGAYLGDGFHGSRRSEEHISSWPIERQGTAFGSVERRGRLSSRNRRIRIGCPANRQGKAIR